jgi:hypothetical protein
LSIYFKIVKGEDPVIKTMSNVKTPACPAGRQNPNQCQNSNSKTFNLRRREIIGTVGRARISSKFYKCGSFEGMGNKALQVNRYIEVFHRQQLTRKRYRCKTFTIPLPALPNWSDFFTPSEGLQLRLKND